MPAKLISDPNVLLDPLVGNLDSKQVSLTRSRIGTLIGRAGELHHLVLQSIFSRITRGEKVCLLVGDNLVDLYVLSRAIRRYGLDPEQALKSIEYSRSFTCNELHHCILNLDMGHAKEWSALYIQGLLDGFYDENIRYHDGERKLNDILVRLRQIASYELPVFITASLPPDGVNRQSFVRRVLDSTDSYWTAIPESSAHLTYQQLTLM